MPGKTQIAWSDLTWNIGVVGCDEVNEGCDNCYARDWHNKWARVRQKWQDLLDDTNVEGQPSGITRAYWVQQRDRTPLQYNAPFSPARRMREVLGEVAYQKRLTWPLHQKQPAMIFVNSMTDLLHSVATDADIREVFDVMGQAHWHTFQVLTKRYGRLRTLGPRLTWTPNVWQGISIAMNKYLPAMGALSEGAAAAQVRFVSLEPLLDDLVDLTPALLRRHRIDWAIVGAESGTGNRGTGKHQRPVGQMDEDWVRRIRDACVAAGTAFFYKQSVDAHGHKTQLPELDGQVWQQYPDAALVGAP